METVMTVRQVQRNFGQVLKNIQAGEKITITRRGEPVALLTAIEPTKEIDWPDFYGEAIETKGKPTSEIVSESREDRI
ncbi:type II toxin-antitoxin system Phd/YefM family antitoxin [Desulfococcus sp.]|uniref:type II toxin-antitoxin system Phd/YefM family antitoxin n=1 Tax=Desulfococcus sp. TaxID=2025834 RepID=UPI00359383A4